MSEFPTQVQCPTAEVVPGEPLRCTLRIYNPSEAVDEYTVVGLGEAAEWVSTDPPSLPLMPETDGEMTLTVLIPADTAIQAGPHTLRVQVRSALDELQPKTEHLSIDVQPLTRWELTAQPTRRRSTRTATYDLEARNHSNHPLTCRLTAVPSSEELALNLSRSVVELPPFRAAAATLQVSVPRKRGGGDLQHYVDIEGQADQTAPQSTRVEFVQKPAPRLLLVSGALLLVGLLFFAVPRLVEMLDSFDWTIGGPNGPAPDGGPNGPTPDGGPNGPAPDGGPNGPPGPLHERPFEDAETTISQEGQPVVLEGAPRFGAHSGDDLAATQGDFDRVAWSARDDGPAIRVEYVANPPVEVDGDAFLQLTVASTGLAGEPFDVPRSLEVVRDAALGSSGGQLQLVVGVVDEERPFRAGVLDSPPDRPGDSVIVIDIAHDRS